MHCRNHVEFKEPEYFAVAIRRLSPDQNHLGLVCDEGNASPKIIHLRNTNHLVSEPFDARYFWVKFAEIDELTQIHLAADCLSLYQMHRIEGLPFSPFADGKFASDGEYAGEPNSGMTCSSFVNEFLKKNAIVLLNEDEWKYRDEDSQWVLEVLSSEGITELNELQQRNQSRLIGVLRFRPEEVAAAAVLLDAPNTMERIIPVSELIKKELNLI